MPPRLGPSRLGPHVVGRRVVVRRVVRGEVGPSGGPAMTDVLGVCTAWDAGTCVVRPESGPEVVIALADIVSGKPVPPRPSPRLRVSPDRAQRRGMALFPDLRTEPLGDWTLRHSPTLGARRANSVLAVHPSGLADDPTGETAYDGVLDWYAGLGRRPIAAVLRDTDEERLFLDRGWVPESGDGDTVFELASVAALARAAGPAPPGEFDGDDRLVTVTLADGAATGVAATDGDWVGVRGVHVDRMSRRRGLGRAVMAALVAWGAERGATTAYLQVLSDNPGALALYAGLGFVEHHRYRYLAAPES